MGLSLNTEDRVLVHGIAALQDAPGTRLTCTAVRASQHFMCELHEHIRSSSRTHSSVSSFRLMAMQHSWH